MNTSIPHPATAVKSLGPRSLAGFMAQPLFIPKEQVSTIIRSPIAIGSRPLGTLLFLGSKIANIARRRTAVDITWPRQRKEYWINMCRYFPIKKRGGYGSSVDWSGLELVFSFIPLYSRAKFGTQCLSASHEWEVLISVLKDRDKKRADDIWKKICKNQVWKEQKI